MVNIQDILTAHLERVVKTIAIFYQGRKQDTSQAAAELAPALQQHGYHVRSVDIREEGEECADSSIRNCEMSIVLGGDGTILNAARLCACVEVPILGINFGRVGFLTELEPQDLLTKLPHYLKRDTSVS